MLKYLTDLTGWEADKIRKGSFWLLGIILVAVAALFANQLLYSNPAQTARQMPPMPVTTVPVQSLDLAITASSVGTLQSHQSVTIRPEITGRVAKIHFREGQKVKAGTILISLDDEITRAALAQAQAELKLAERNYKRAVDLYARNVGTGRTRDETLSKLDVARARVEVARANFNKTRLTAPFGGIVGLRQVDEGAYVKPGQDLVNLENINPIKVDFRLPETLLPQLEAGQKLKISVDAYPGQIFEGSILALDPRVDTAGRSVAIRALIPNSAGLLHPGLFARVTLTVTHHKNALMVPEESIVAEGDKFFVFKVVKGHVARIAVTLGAHKNGKVELLKGLAAHDVVVTAGQEKLRDGAPVVSVNPASKPNGGA